MTLEFPCGALALGSPLYIERPPVESLSYQNIETPGSLTRIKGPRHMGKSSLLVRLLAHAQKQDYKTALVDFQSAEDAIYSDLSRFLRWFCTAVARQLKLPPRLADFWDDETGAKLSCTIYFEDYLLDVIDTPIVLALNEVNRVFERPEIARDFLPLLRFWYEQAKQADAFQKLRTLVVHSTDIYVPLNINQSPFNVGLPIHLSAFDQAQVQALAARYNVSLGNSTEQQALMALVGGHPYLLSIAFYYLAQGQLSLRQLTQTAATPAGVYSNHLQACLETLQQQPLLTEALREVILSPEPVELGATCAHQLASLGIVTLEGSTCRPACELYRLFFTQHGLLAPPQESRFQALEAENEQLKVLAHLDGLTQIANRRAFDQRLDLEWQRAAKSHSPLALIMLDIDCFKLYNDTYGHLAGDFCLQQVAQVLSDRARQSSDLAARYGGEEFAIILPRMTLHEATQFAYQIRASILDLNIVHSASTVARKVVTSSIGVASIVPQLDQPCSTLIVIADAALYISKQQGRDRVTVSNKPASGPSSRLAH
ncbi:MAG: AAA-like domain-containing protein [Cyanobacteria bacterium P01_D01_bin.44]